MGQRVLVAFDKFKDALSAERACGVAARELRRLHPDWTIDTTPLTDGGDGFCHILTEALTGEIVNEPATGPLMERIEAPIGFVDGSRLPEAARDMLAAVPGARWDFSRIAVIEMAATSGLALVPPDRRDPWHTTSFGTGQLIRAAAERGAGLIVLGVGGSATSDLGLGALAALGLEFRTTDGAKIRPPFPGSWERITRIEGEVFPALPPIVIACDVTNPLFGPNGAAAIYGPQKGLSAIDRPLHESQAARMAALLCASHGLDPIAEATASGAGAAGGITFGLRTAAPSRVGVVGGFDLVSAWLGLEDRVRTADIVITGEGRFDTSSLSGKGPGALVHMSSAAGRRTVVFAGAVDSGLPSRDSFAAVAISPPGLPLADALAATEANLAAAIAKRFPAS